MQENIKKKSFWLLLCGWIVIAVIYARVFIKASVIDMISDFFIHNVFCMYFISGNMQIMYPGYHFVVGTLWKLTDINTMYLAVPVLTIASLLSVYMTEKIIIEISDEFSRVQTFGLAILVNFIQPIFTHSIRPGYSSGNGYISPTQIFCKPFILLTILLFYRSYKKDCWSIGGQIWLTIVLIISCIIKPMFAMAFVPAMGLMLLTEGIQTKNLKKFIIQIVPLFLTGLFLIGQFVYMKNITMGSPDPNLPVGGTDPESQIKIGFMYAWRMCVGNVPLSIIFAYFAPILTFIVVMIKRIKLDSNQRKFAKIGIFYLIISFIYISFLYQTKYEKDLNFRNGWIVSFLLIHILNIEIVSSEIKDKNTKNMILPICGISIQMLFGIALLIKNMFFTIS